MPARVLRWITPGLFLAAVLLPAGCGGEPEAQSEAAPDFELQTLEGESIRLADYRGKVVLIDFWATWCQPCRRQVPHLKSLYTELRPSGFEIVGIAVGDREESVRKFVAQAQIEYPVTMGTDEVVTAFGNFTTIPTVFLVDRNGKIARRYTGLQDRQVLESHIRRALDAES